MTNEEMRVAIAKACGWTEVRMQNISGLCLPIEEAFGIPPNKNSRERLPNYPEDLNAINDAVNTLTEIDRLRWIEQIDHATEHLSSGWFPWRMVTATAAQRCEAFLKVKGLWKEAAKIPNPPGSVRPFDFSDPGETMS